MEKGPRNLSELEGIEGAPRGRKAFLSHFPEKGKGEVEVLGRAPLEAVGPVFESPSKVDNQLLPFVGKGKAEKEPHRMPRPAVSDSRGPSTASRARPKQRRLSPAREAASRPTRAASREPSPEARSIQR